tara:strand:+ start:5180 stop:5575 length:396 start_codon:yes stop_codon:yes gene_type:complete
MSRTPNGKTNETKRPSVADAMATANRHNDGRTGRQPGTIVNGEPGLEYYWLDPPEIKEGRLRKIRDSLRERGYWKTDGDEYVPECSTAEVWATYEEVARTHFEDRVKRNNAARSIFEEGVASRSESITLSP